MTNVDRLTTEVIKLSETDRMNVVCKALLWTHHQRDESYIDIDITVNAISEYLNLDMRVTSRLIESEVEND